MRTSPEDAMAWGIDLCGQLASVHREGVVVGSIGPATINRSPSGDWQLPEPDARVSHAPWVDVSALADAIRSLVPDPPTELTNALLPPYASAVALGEELQDAQRALGFAVVPIPLDDESASPGSVGFGPSVEESAAVAPPGELPPELDLDPAELARNPNSRVLLAIVVVVLLAAVVVGIGWR